VTRGSLPKLFWAQAPTPSASTPVLRWSTSSESVGDLRRASIKLGDSLSYPAGDFDAALCILPIHHVADRRTAFSELYRVARPGGVLIVCAQHPSTDWLRYAASCFDTAPEADTWRLHDGIQHVRFWAGTIVRTMGSCAPWPVHVHYLVSHEQGCDTPAAWIRRFPS
jgi:SAM-dependent methyltransferase